MFYLLANRIAYLDGVIGRRGDLKEEILARFPDTTIQVMSIDYPIDRRVFAQSRSCDHHVIRIGYSGRLEDEQKYVTGLIDFCEALDTHQVSSIRNCWVRFDARFRTTTAT